MQADDGQCAADMEHAPAFPCLLGGPRRLPVDAELFEEGDLAWQLQWDAASRVEVAGQADGQTELAGVLEAEAAARCGAVALPSITGGCVSCVCWLIHNMRPELWRSAAAGRQGKAM